MIDATSPHQAYQDKVRISRAAGDWYGNSKAGSGYAMGRPRVHPAIIERLIPHLGATLPVAWALDIGCGAGLSTAALAPVARSRLGLDPYRQMLSDHELVAPGADFVVAAAEELPLRDDVMDLVTAAGVVNYTDTARLLPEIRRVMRPDGTLAIYDFGQGRKSATAPGLSEWFNQYQVKYPSESGYALDARALDYQSAGLALLSYEQFDVTVRMDQPSYVDYALTGSGVLRQVAAAESSAAAKMAHIKAWCEATLASVFASPEIDVNFPCYLAVVKMALR